MSLNVHSTVVEIRTSLGIIEVNLFDNTTPETVANFLSYANSGAYASSVVHRSVSNFVIQGGGFTYNGPVAVNSFSLDSISTGTPIANDPKLSNLRGTIAMAKTSSPDSATSQWFINLSNNANSLDVATNAGGFTVFGQVVGDGMQVVDAIAALTLLNGGGAFGELPIRDYTQTDVNNEVPITDDNLVVISDIVVIDNEISTYPDLNPPINVLINDDPVAEDDNYIVVIGKSISGNVITHNDGDGKIDSDGTVGDVLIITQVNGIDLVFQSATGEAEVEVQGGILRIKKNGSFNYTHNGDGAAGVILNFSYTLSDEKETDVGKVTFEVKLDDSEGPSNTDSGGGGAVGWLLLLGLVMLQKTRLFKR